MRIIVAGNPAARFSRSESVATRVEHVLREAGHEVEHIVKISAASTLEAVREAIADGAEVLVAVGGDGTVHLALNAVVGTDTILAVIPAGSGNDFARSIGVGTSVEQAIDALPARLADAPARCDLMRIDHAGGEVYAAGILSVGFDADVTVRSYELGRVPTALRYQTAIALTLPRVKHRRITLTIDDEAPVHLDTVVAGVANNTILGGGIPLAPQASMTDGLLSFVWADRVPYLGFMRLLTKALRGTHLDDPHVHTAEGTTVLVEGEGVTACADGEVIGTLPMRCTIVPGAIRVAGTPI